MIYTEAEKKIKDHESQLQDIKPKVDGWDSFKKNGGSINGGLNLLKNGITNYLGYNNFTPVCSSWSVKGASITDFIGVNLAVQPEQWSALVPFNKNDMFLGIQDVPWKDIFVGGFKGETNGYTSIGNGFILQWGKIVRTGEEAKSWLLYIDFPTPFPTSCLNVVGFVHAQDSNTNPRVVSGYVSQNSRTRFVTRGLAIGLPLEQTITTTEINWIAIGR